MASRGEQEAVLEQWFSRTDVHPDRRTSFSTRQGGLTLFQELELHGLVEPVQIQEMQQHIRSGRFTMEHYESEWGAKLAQMGRASAAPATGGRNRGALTLGGDGGPGGSRGGGGRRREGGGS